LSVTDIGILPKNIWKDLTPETFTLSDYNQKGIGSGPYLIESVQKEKGIPSEYTLRAFKDFTTGSSYIQTLRVLLFKDEVVSVEYLKQNNFTSVAILDPSKASAFSGSERFTTVQKTLPRVYALYFNQSKNQNLVDQKVRSAIDSAIDKKRIITESVYGFAELACSPIPKVVFESVCKDSYSAEQAVILLQSAGYTKNSAGYFAKNGTELTLNITSVRNAPEIERAAEIIRQNLEAVGIKTIVTSLDIADINQRVIKERDYEILLYGAQVKKSADLYAYWHSSQKVAPGLNLSLYANTNVDQDLEKLRTKITDEDKLDTYDAITAEIKKDTPAVFLFSPTFAYVYDNKIKIEDSGDITEVSDRLSQVTSWYTQTEYVWSGLQNIEWLKKIRNKIY
jgi:peptide/nickel transport system substrate-binding protein